MQIQQSIFRDGAWSPALKPMPEANWILAFGQRDLLRQAAEALAASNPQALLIASSTSGEIHADEVDDATVSATLVGFGHTRTTMAHVRCANIAQSAESGRTLGLALAGAGLTHVFVLSNGLTVNGTALTAALQEAVGAGVSISGGLAGDGANFAETLVIAGAESGADLVAAIGFYGDALTVTCGSWGGWQPFGPARQVSKSSGSVLHELDQKSALAKYKEYLGEHAGGMPVNALLFPILITPKDSDRSMVRTVLSIDDETQSMTFAGDVPVGASVQLMRSNTEALVDGARKAATMSMEGRAHESELAVLVSCIGRKLVMKQRVEEELEAVREVVGPQARMTGFYSYGELAPRKTGEPCDLHNQTMTVTLFSERG